jgi:hypothetical protein
MTFARPAVRTRTSVVVESAGLQQPVRPNPQAAAVPARAGPAIQARRVGLPADQPRPLRRSKDGQTIFPLPPAQDPKATLNRRFPTSRKNLNQHPCLHLAGRHRRQPGTLGPAEDHTAQHAGHRVRRPSRQSAASSTGEQVADERMVPRQLDLSSIVGELMLKSASSASNPGGSMCGGRFCLGGMRMPWPRPSGAGLPAQRQGPWRGVPAQ